MKLDPKHVTAASRTMLPAYPILALLFGFNYLTTPTGHLTSTSPTLQVTNNVLPLPVWGAMFVAVGIVQVVAMVVQRRHLYELALALMCGVCAFLALVFSAISVGLVGAALMWVGAAVAGTVILNGYRRTGWVLTLVGGMAAILYAAQNGQGSPTAWCWPLFVAVACWASIRSITTRETTE